MMSSLQAGLGVLVGSEQEGSQITGLLILPFMIPLFLMFSFVTDPNGTVPQILSFIPFTAPMSMVFRMSMGTVPAWEIVLSIVIATIATIFFVWLAARVFRWGMLLYGKKFSPMGILKAIRPGSGATVQTTAPVTREGLQ
jgi:ABC-2 type transport system permease protein